ncbi:hypothetical protein [Frankia gtarii]|uniref:hypothetical protein n=1 Tax=Frankia gtarii TaxID=2950102 RepID=UPI0021C1CA58|nr:hypothetical protein [Frankia gtarii]
MNTNSLVLGLAERLIHHACRYLPQPERDERYREWIAELPAILHDPDIRPALRRAVDVLIYAADQRRAAFGMRAIATAPGPRGDSDLVERLAQAAHERYLANERARGAMMGAHRAMAPWEKLPRDLRDANRAMVAHLGEILLARHGMMMSVGEAGSDFTFTEAEIDDLAKQEYLRWRRERERQGFTAGPGSPNGRNRLHPAVVDWDELSPRDQDRDRDVIRSVPALLAWAGMRIVHLDD